MSYNDEYNETEEDYESDTFKEKQDNKKDKLSNNSIIDDLNKYAKNGDIKGIRNYIDLHRKELDNYKTRVLNNNVNIDNYIFVRREGKLMIIKVKKTKTYDIANNIKSVDKTLENSDNNTNKKRTSNKLATDEPHKENYNREPININTSSAYSIDNTETESYDNYNYGNASIADINDNYISANNTIESTDSSRNPLTFENAINSPIKGESNNSLLFDSSNNIRTFPTIPRFKPFINNSAAMANNLNVNSQTVPTIQRFKPAITNTDTITTNSSNQPLFNPGLPIDNVSVANLLNKLSQQAYFQNETQQKQYDQLTKTLNDSLIAKNNIEQERLNKLNNCVNNIEKTFSAGTFDRIIDSINDMVKTLTIRHDESLEKVNNLYNEFQAIKENVIENANKCDSLNEEIIKISDDANTIESLNYQLEQQEQTMEDLYVAVDEQKEEIIALKSNIEDMRKQYNDNINKVMLCLFNVDEDIFNKVFGEKGNK